MINDGFLSLKPERGTKFLYFVLKEEFENG